MADFDHLQDNLDFVRAAVARGRDDRGTAAIYFLWAVIVGVGFALPDFAPHWAWHWWVIGGLTGGALSYWLGGRHEKNRGVRDAALAQRHAWHWLTSGFALALLVVAIYQGKLPSGSAAPMLLAVAGLSYTLAGIHLHPPLRWAGLTMLICAAIMLFLPLPYLWSATGAAVALALTLGGLFALRAPSA